MSNMDGVKSKYLSEYAKKNNFSFLTFDFRGHGKSSGEFVNYGIIDWYNDLNKIINYLNISRFILEILLIVIFLADYGVLGAAYILFFSRFFETIVAYFFNIKNGIFTLSISLVLLVFLIFYILVFIN